MALAVKEADPDLKSRVEEYIVKWCSANTLKALSRVHFEVQETFGLKPNVPALLREHITKTMCQEGRRDDGLLQTQPGTFARDWKSRQMLELQSISCVL